jgi:hypothetical protein
VSGGFRWTLTPAGAGPGHLSRVFETLLWEIRDKIDMHVMYLAMIILPMGARPIASIGTLGPLSLIHREWIIPAALAGGLFKLARAAMSKNVKSVRGGWLK